MKRLILYILLALTIPVSWYGCDSLPKKDDEKDKKKDEKINLDFLGKGKKSSHKTTVEEETIKHPEHKASGRKPVDYKKPETKEAPPAVKRKPFYHDFISKGKPGKKSVDVKVDFPSTGIADVVKAFSMYLGFSYTLDPEVKGTITMSINAKLTHEEIWKIFEEILGTCGAYCAPAGKMLKIAPISKMPLQDQVNSEHADRQTLSNVQLLVYPLKNADSKATVTQLKPFMNQGGTLIELTRQNAVMLVDTPDNIPRLLKVLKALDKENKFNWHKSVIPCHNVSALRIVNELAEVMPVLGFPVTTKLESAEPGSVQISAIERLQIIVSSAANKEALAELRRWVTILDKTDVGEQERVFIYHVVNGKADELVQALSVIFPIEGTTLAVKSSGSSSGTNSSSSSKSSSTKTSATKSSKKSGSDEDGPASVFETPVRIFADAVQNRLVVRTTPRTYAMMKAVLERLDTVAAQVLLQVLVVEISLTDTTKFGMEFSMAGGGSNAESIFSTNYNNLTPASGQDSQYGGKFWIFNPQRRRGAKHIQLSKNTRHNPLILKFKNLKFSNFKTHRFSESFSWGGGFFCPGTRCFLTLPSSLSPKTESYR